MINETEQAVRTAFTTGAPNTVSDATAATFREQMLSRGIAADEVEATLARNGYGQRQSGSQQTVRQSAQAEVDAATKTRPFSTAELQTAADTLRKFWTGPQDELEAALAAAGAPKADSAGLDTRTEQEREFDASSLGAGAPEDYDLNGLWLGRDASMQDMAELTGPIRTALSALSVPKAAGMSFAEAIADSRAATGDLEDKSPEAQQTFHMQQRADFARAAKIGWEQAAAQMKPWLAKLPAATRDFLANTGAFNTTTAMIRLWSTYQLVSARAKMGGKP
jgi:hypothetical protein